MSSFVLRPVSTNTHGLCGWNIGLHYVVQLPQTRACLTTAVILHCSVPRLVLTVHLYDFNLFLTPLTSFILKLSFIKLFSCASSNAIGTAHGGLDIVVGIDTFLFPSSHKQLAIQSQRGYMFGLE